MKTVLKLSILTSLALFLFSSCGGSTKIVSSWKSWNIPNNGLDKVLVLALAGDQETEMNKKIELAMSNELNILGVNAQTANSIFGAKNLDHLSEKEILEKLKDSAFTSVMMISLLDKEKERVYRPGTFYLSPEVVSYNHFYRRYHIVHNQVNTAGYYTEETKYILQAELFCIPTDELLYSGKTKSYNPRNKKSLSADFSKRIAKDMIQSGVILK